MSTAITIAIIVMALFAVGMLRERIRERKLRAWITKYGGKLHWPFRPAEHPAFPAAALALCFAPRGARLWAVALEYTTADRCLWLVEFESTALGHRSGKWHCMLAESCGSAAVAERIRLERNAATRNPWVAVEGWVAKRHQSLISADLLDELAERVKSPPP